MEMEKGIFGKMLRKCNNVDDSWVKNREYLLVVNILDYDKVKATRNKCNSVATLITTFLCSCHRGFLPFSSVS